MTKLINILPIIISLIASIAVYSDVCAEGPNPNNLLIGKWRPIWAQTPIPKECQSGFSTVSSDGTIKVVSGEREEILSYTIQGPGPRYAVVSRFLSDNSKPNCQGYAPSEVRKGRDVTSYVEFNSTGEFYFLYSDPAGTYVHTIERKVE